MYVLEHITSDKKNIYCESLDYFFNFILDSDVCTFNRILEFVDHKYKYCEIINLD